MSDATASFNAAFQALCTGHAPFRWQCRLFDRLAQGHVPPSCSLPTGLGKTSIIPIWLIALAQSARANNGRPRLPRRLVYIVNRRTVVDQATDDAKRLLGRIYRSGQRDGLPWATDEAIAAFGLKDEPPLPDEHAPTVATLREALAVLSGDDTAAPLAVSALRGELADNAEWKVNPARPAIIIGTVDMIGSKLLFSGYGDRRYGRAHHAGLIGQDALIVHDEAHLSPAFSRLLWKVEHEHRIGERGETSRDRSIHVMELSATTRPEPEEARKVREEAFEHRPGTSKGGVFDLEDDDREEKIVKDRLNATKRLKFEPVEGSGKDALAQVIAKHATQHDVGKCRVLVYVRSPETAAAIVEAIKDKLGLKKATSEEVGNRVRLLTGTIRGYERDQLAESDLFKKFKSDPNRPLQLEHTLYLVSTSAGEVGADLDADHLVCDLTTLDSMAQRFGRVNRLGGDGRSACVALVHEKAKDVDKAQGPKGKHKKQSPFDIAVAAAGAMLRKIADNGGDVSPAALRPVLESDEAKTAFSPTPTILPVTDILFDAWSLTSIREELPGRPEVAPYLHGIAEHEPPETYVAWRAEISELAAAGIKEDQLDQIFEVFSLRAAERLRDRTDRVQNELQKIAARHPQIRAVLIKNDTARWITLSELVPDDNRRKEQVRRSLAYATIVLPTEVGGLNDGFLDGGSREDVLDVAEVSVAGQRVRQRLWVRDGSLPGVLSEAPSTGLIARHAVGLGKLDPDDEESPPAATIEYRIAPGESSEPGAAVALQDHSSAVEAAADRIGRALGLEDSIRKALTLAARWHDAGKSRAVWQRYARNGDPGATALAKAKRYLHPKALAGYRHEFGSLLDAALGQNGAVPPAEIADHPERDLILHLIAAHHGWGRPHFESKAFDRERPTSENEAVAVEVMQRFARLQQRFGRWGLAWLESLLRCADAMGSQPAETGDQTRRQASDPSRDREGAGASPEAQTSSLARATEDSHEHSRAGHLHPRRCDQPRPVLRLLRAAGTGAPAVAGRGGVVRRW